MENEDDIRYELTPKGCATIALMYSGLVTNTEDHRIETFWILFEHYMRKNDYIQEE